VVPHSNIVKKKSRSCFDVFYKIEDGVISLSLRDMTLVGCFLITVALLYMLYTACKDGAVECTYPRLPMISDVICLKYYDRIFCLFSCYFCLATYQVDVRAFYSRLYGIASDCQNDTLLVLGLISTFSLPAIGFFDEHTWGTIHGIMAVLFFASVGIYAWIIGGIMNDNLLKFPTSQWVEIKIMYKLRYVMMAVLLILALSGSLDAFPDWVFPLSEWVTTILYLNYFAILSFTNQYYDSVHPFDTNLSGKKIEDNESLNTTISNNCV